MKLEQLYALAYAACLRYAETDGAYTSADDVRAYVDNTITHCASIAPCYELARALREELDRKAAGSALPALKRIIANAKKKLPSSRAGAWIDPNTGRQCISDGVSGITLNMPIASLERVPDDVIRASGGAPALDSLIDSVAETAAADITAYVPTVAQIKAARAEAEAAGIDPKIAQISNTRTWINTDYLRNVLEALPGCRVYASNSPLSPLYFTGDTGRGALCPVRHGDDAPAGYTLPQRGKA